MKPFHFALAGALLCAAAPLQAQNQPVMLSEAAQIASAVAPLPDQFRAEATVLGYRPGNPRLITLRQGKGPFICLASDPATPQRFHVACYHQSLEQFMARGREIRAANPGTTEVDSVRYAEIRAGRLKMPNGASALYSLTGTPAHVDASGAVNGARLLYVVYVPFATAESTGLPTTPGPGGNTPWLMGAGTPKAHIMFVPTM